MRVCVSDEMREVLEDCTCRWLDIHARFSGGLLSSDDGVLVLREIEKGLNFADTLAACLHGKRVSLRIRHSCSSMIGSRLLASASRYEDCDDQDELRDDPVERR